MRLPTHPLCAVAAVAVAFASRPDVPLRRQGTEPLFAAGERARLVEWWNQSERWTSEPQFTDGKQGPWAPRATVDGSAWQFRYRNAVRGARKIPPGQDVVAEDDGPTAGWERWLAAKIAWDWHRARKSAADANSALPGAPPATPAQPEPPSPGPIPETLLAACGNPPAFAQAVVPLRHRVKLDNPDSEYQFNDNVKVKERFAFYRWSQGVVSVGTKLADLPENVLADRFSRGGFPASQQRIFTAVSRLEGGFDTVQTYDTGHVSVGFIQFITHQDGRHSLSAVLEREKTDSPESFETDFRRYGVDIRTDRTLVVVDPSTGAELAGADAVTKIIDDKRLVAVFQRAGRHSDAFQVAQIRTARDRYWPGDERFEIEGAGGKRIAGTVADIVRSEAGMAILVDRKVNSGSIAPFGDVVARVAKEFACSDLDDLRAREREIVSALRYRTDFLADTKLSQPAGGNVSRNLSGNRSGLLAQDLPSRGAGKRRQPRTSASNPAKP